METNAPTQAAEHCFAALPYDAVRPYDANPAEPDAHGADCRAVVLAHPHPTGPAETVAQYLLLTAHKGGLDMTKLRLAVLPLALALLFFVGVGSPKVLAAPLGNSTTGFGTATCGSVTYTFLLAGHANDHAAVHVLSASDGSNVNNLILADLSGPGFGFPPHGQQTGLQGSILSGCTGTVTFGPFTFPFTADLFAVPR